MNQCPLLACTGTRHTHGAHSHNIVYTGMHMVHIGTHMVYRHTHKMHRPHMVHRLTHGTPTHKCTGTHMVHIGTHMTYRHSNGQNITYIK